METYLDYNATSPIDPRVFESMKPFLTHSYANASSLHRQGQKARHGIEEAREIIAESIDAEPGDLIFTSGGTEADNLAIQGAMEFLGKNRTHLVISSVEHQAVLAPAKILEEKGFEVSLAPVSSKGLVDINFLKETISDKTALVSVMHVNNEVGTIQPIDEIAKIAHAKGALLHVDAVQSFGKLALSVEDLSIDMLTISAHKICGPKGVGALYFKKGLKVKPMLYGGHQEKNIRPGTENPAAIVGFGKAARLALDELITDRDRIVLLRQRLEEKLFGQVKGIRLNGHPIERIYNTLNVSFEGLEGETLLMHLDLKNISASTGSACTAGSVEASHVLLAMGVPEKLARAAIRFSLGRFTKKEEIDYAAEEIPRIVDHLRKVSLEKKDKKT